MSERRDPTKDYDLIATKRIVMKSFTSYPVHVKAVKYAGRCMDKELMEKFPEFHLAYIEDFPSLVLRGCKKPPYSGDWIVFDRFGRHPFEVLSEIEFKNKYQGTF